MFASGLVPKQRSVTRMPVVPRFRWVMAFIIVRTRSDRSGAPGAASGTVRYCLGVGHRDGPDLGGDGHAARREAQGALERRARAVRDRHVRRDAGAARRAHRRDGGAPAAPRDRRELAARDPLLQRRIRVGGTRPRLHVRRRGRHLARRRRRLPPADRGGVGVRVPRRLDRRRTTARSPRSPGRAPTA